MVRRKGTLISNPLIEHPDLLSVVGDPNYGRAGVVLNYGNKEDMAS